MIEEIRSERKAAIYKAYANVRVIGITLSRLIARIDMLPPADLVVIDEASMAMLPQVIIAGGLAPQQVILGDPQQILPIVKSRAPEAQGFVKRDIFRQLQLEDPALDDPRRPMLTEQHRMHPTIGTFVSETFYASRLTNAPALILTEIEVDVPLLVLDTSRLDAACDKVGSSRVNEVHIDVVKSAVSWLRAQGEPEIGVITPFRTQTNKIREALKEFPSFFRQGGFVRTIHRTQGGEQNAVIVDLVEAPPTMGVLDDSWNKELSNLMCVALSRSKKQLILVAHLDGLYTRYSRNPNRIPLLLRILERATEDGVVVRLTTSDVQIPVGD